jgi:hypothetical protein
LPPTKAGSLVISSYSTEEKKNFMYTNENLFVYNKIKKDNKTIGLVAIRFELSELNKIKNGFCIWGLYY